MKDPVEGTATLVSYGTFPSASHDGDTVLQMQVVVEAEGLAPTAVEAIHTVTEGQLPLSSGTVFKVRVDRQKPTRIKFLDDDPGLAQAQLLAGRVEAERLAAAMRAGTPAAAGPAVPGVHVLGAAGAEQVAQGIAAAEAALGMDLDGDGRVGAAPPPPAPAPAAAEDPVTTLERLGKLRDAGTLTEAEFEAQKRRVLESL